MMQKMDRMRGITGVTKIATVLMSAGLVGVFFGISTVVLAANNSTFNQAINAGTLATDIRSNSSTSVSSPAVTMSAKTFSFNCQSGGSASTGTFGTSGERIYVDNPDAADNGWTLTIAATGGATTLWQNGGSTQNFDFNDAGGSGCTDGGDADSKGGQLTIDPSVATTTTDYSGSSTTGISLGSSSAFVQGSVDNVTLVTASAGSADIWRGYFTGIGLSQVIPAEQPVDSYNINLTLTVTAS
jgi:hypothetical protein